MHPITKFVNQLLIKRLLHASVESFGLTHQVLTLTFRDGKAEDHTLWIDTEVLAERQLASSLKVDEIATALLLFNSVNLKSITAICCTDEADLSIEFDNGVKLSFSGTPTDETIAEPWQLKSDDSAEQYSVIALNGGGYAVFGGNSTSA